MTDSSISIRPGVAMLGLFPHMKYQPWYALGELVDNAIQSYVGNRDRLHDAEPGDYRLRIAIEIDRSDGGSIVVRDNAAGIADSDWERAFRVAEPPADSSGLSQFGVGMKAACCWFAEKWSLRTTHLGDTVVRTVSFDVPAIIAAREETLAVEETPTDWASHFTEVRMTHLHRVPQTRTIQKIREYLGAIYRQFIRDGEVEITFNGEPISFVEPQVLRAPLWRNRDAPPFDWRKDVDLRLESGRRVHGFVGVRATGSTSQAGLALFYRKKVVTGAGDDTYRPEVIFGRSNSFRSQRVFGELHMDDFSVTYTKDALVWFDEEDEFVNLLRDEMDAPPMPVLKQAENWRSRVVAAASTDDASRAASGIIDAFTPVPGGSAPTIDVELPIHGADGEAAPTTGSTHAEVDRELTVHSGGTDWVVRLRLVVEEANRDWLSVAVQEQDGATKRMTIQLNQAHPFMRAWCEAPGQEIEPVWRVAVAIGLAQELARQGGAKMPGLVIENVNHLLRTFLAQKS